MTTPADSAARPPGLTRLALASFAAAAAIAVGQLALLVGPAAAPRAGFYLVVALGLAAALLCAAAGADYLARRRRGRRLGLLYAAVGLAGAVLQLAAVPAAFGVTTVVNTVHPLVTVCALARLRDGFAAAASPPAPDPGAPDAPPPAVI
jgi:hypothetical protein